MCIQISLMENPETKFLENTEEIENYSQQIIELNQLYASALSNDPEITSSPLFVRNYLANYSTFLLKLQKTLHNSHMTFEELCQNSQIRSDIFIAFQIWHTMSLFQEEDYRESTLKQQKIRVDNTNKLSDNIINNNSSINKNDNNSEIYNNANITNNSDIINNNSDKINNNNSDTVNNKDKIKDSNKKIDNDNMNQKSDNSIDFSEELDENFSDISSNEEENTILPSFSELNEIKQKLIIRNQNLNSRGYKIDFYLTKDDYLLKLSKDLDTLLYSDVLNQPKENPFYHSLSFIEYTHQYFAFRDFYQNLKNPIYDHILFLFNNINIISGMEIKEIIFVFKQIIAFYHVNLQRNTPINFSTPIMSDRILTPFDLYIRKQNINGLYFKELQTLSDIQEDRITFVKISEKD